jgi:hypothetical protein
MRDGLTAVRKAKINEIFTKIEYLLRFIKKRWWAMRFMGVSMNASLRLWKTFQQPVNSLLEM